MVEQYFDFSDRAAFIDPVYERARGFDRSNDLNGGVRTGAMVATASGLKPIETLLKNDLVLTRDNGYVSLTNVQRMPATSESPKKFDVCIRHIRWDDFCRRRISVLRQANWFYCRGPTICHRPKPLCVQLIWYILIVVFALSKRNLTAMSLPVLSTKFF